MFSVYWYAGYGRDFKALSETVDDVLGKKVYVHAKKGYHMGKWQRSILMRGARKSITQNK
jgi:hypothetical protein